MKKINILITSIFTFSTIFSGFFLTNAHAAQPHTTQVQSVVITNPVDETLKRNY